MNPQKNKLSPNDCRHLLMICLFCALLAGCDRFGGEFAFQSDSAAQQRDPLTVNVMQVSHDEQAIETAVFFGTLQPNRQSRLGFGRGGQIKDVFKLVGQRATKGDKLAELEQDQLDKQKSQLEKQLLEARKNLQADLPMTAPAQQQVSLLESQLEDIETELAKGIILAPYDCIIAEKSIEVGDLTSQSIPALEVVDANGASVIADLPRKIADALNVGYSVWVGVAAQSVSAQIKTKSPVETSAGSTTITLQIPDSSTQDWTFGQTVEIRFFLPTQNSGYWIPLSALTQETNGLWSVLTVQNESDSETSTTSQQQVAQKILEIVQLEDEWALVKGALAEGERIIVSGSHRIVSGQIVKTNDVTGGFKKPGAGANE